VIDLKKINLVTSPLCTNFESEGKRVEIDIFGSAHKGWFLTVTDEHGNSIAWRDFFSSDQAALNEVMETISDRGIRCLFDT
jgi:hypothetical protein